MLFRSGGETGLAKLGGAHLLDGEVAALEELEDDGTLEEGVVGEVHDSAAACADLADKLVLLDYAALHEFIIARGMVWMVEGELFGWEVSSKNGTEFIYLQGR